MVLKHIPQDSRTLKIARPLLNTQFFSDRNLDIVNIAPVPERFEDSVCESKHYDILNGLLTKIMVDPINLLL